MGTDPNFLLGSSQIRPDINKNITNATEMLKIGNSGDSKGLHVVNAQIPGTIANAFSKATIEFERKLKIIKNENCSKIEEYKLLTNLFLTLQANHQTIQNDLVTLQDKDDRIAKQNASSNQAMKQDTGYNGTDINGLSHLKETNITNKQFIAILKYLWQEKKILTDKNEALNAKYDAIKVKYESANAKLHENQTALKLANKKAGLNMISVHKFEEILEQIPNMVLLKEENKRLSEEKNLMKKKVDELINQISQRNEEIEPLKTKLTTQDDRQDKQQNEIKTLTAENEKWKIRVSSLINKQKSTAPKELEVLKIDLSKLQ